ncbi:MAG: hypothetical protein SPD11_03820 [Sphaerochaetaceae bacterium]|nr:hypothetical protein [Sphaerochaetaceae bacterium]
MLTAQELYDALLAGYGKPRWWSDNPYEVMVEAVLVQNTAWSNVEKARAAIGEKLTPECIAAMHQKELEQLIRSCGFYTAKAETIKALTSWYGKFRYDPACAQDISTQRLRGELLSLRGVGAETADVILVFCFFRPSFIVDTYTRRLLARLGFEFSDDAAVKMYFESGLQEDAQLYGWFHWLILEHCISLCKKTPNCSACRFESHCALPSSEAVK